MACDWRFGLLLRLSMVVVSFSVAGCQRGAPGDAAGRVATATQPRSAPAAGYAFAAPVRLKGGDEWIRVESPGYACPTVADVDGDGIEDLVVGQFNQGQMQFFKNLAAKGEEPKLASPEWLMTGEERAVVPGVS